jgi:hypothetical protein
MKPFGKSHLKIRRAAALCVMAALFAGTPLARAAKKDATDTPTPAADGSPTASPTPNRLNIPIPVSHDAKGVRLPYFDSHGKLQMFFNIKMAVRTDLNHLSMENAFMQTYDDKGAADANVFMTSSVLDLDTRIVTSDVPVTVRRSDFEIVGQKMVFNTQTHVGHLSGHVRMVIYNHQDVSQSSPTPSASSASPSPSAAPQPSATPQ